MTIPPGRYQGLLLSVILSWALLLRAMISFWISVVPPKIAGWAGAGNGGPVGLLGQPSDDLVGRDERWPKTGSG